MSNARKKAFRQYLAELVHFLALPRRAQETTGTADKVYARLRRYALRAGDPDSYLFRIARAIAYESRHRRAQGSRHIG